MNFQPLLSKESKTDVCIALMRGKCGGRHADPWPVTVTAQLDSGPRRGQGRRSSGVTQAQREQIQITEGARTGAGKGQGSKEGIFNLKSKNENKNQLQPIKICFSFWDREKETKTGWGQQEDKVGPSAKEELGIGFRLLGLAVLPSETQYPPT